MTAPLVYLDHAATTPVRPEVRDAMLPLLGGELFGNPSSGHRAGRAARTVLEGARRELAETLEVSPEAVYFTSGGTEANNLAILGSCLAARDRGDAMAVAAPATEHKAVLAALHAVAHLGGREELLPVGVDGLVEWAAVVRALRARPTLLSVMWVNNETGVVQPIAELAARARAAGVCFHSDLVQGFGKLPLSLREGPLDLATISAHKIGGPKGVGALIVRDAAQVAPLIHGGGQQGGLRPGTENIAGAVGLARAATLARQERAEGHARLTTLADALVRGLRARLPELQVAAEGGPRAGHIVNLMLPSARSDSLLAQLDVAGIAASGGSACASGAIEPSHVLLAMGLPHALAASAVRFSFGRESTMADVERVLELFPPIAERAVRLAGALQRA